MGNKIYSFMKFILLIYHQYQIKVDLKQFLTYFGNFIANF